MKSNNVCRGHALRMAVGIIVLAIILQISLGHVQAETETPGSFQMPGMLEGTGTYFEINDSSYLNISLNSSEPINFDYYTPQLAAVGTTMEQLIT